MALHPDEYTFTMLAPHATERIVSFISHTCGHLSRVDARLSDAQLYVDQVMRQRPAKHGPEAA